MKVSLFTLLVVALFIRPAFPGSYTITATTEQDAGLQGVADKYNATAPLVKIIVDGKEGFKPAPLLTAAEYLQMVISSALTDYANELKRQSACGKLTDAEKGLLHCR